MDPVAAAGAAVAVFALPPCGGGSGWGVARFTLPPCGVGFGSIDSLPPCGGALGSIDSLQACWGGPGSIDSLPPCGGGSGRGVSRSATAPAISAERMANGTCGDSVAACARAIERPASGAATRATNTHAIASPVVLRFMGLPGKRPAGWSLSAPERYRPIIRLLSWTAT